MKINNETITVIGIEIELSYAERMELIRMLTQDSPEGKVKMRLSSVHTQENPSVHVSISGGLGVMVQMSDYAVKVKEVTA